MNIYGCDAVFAVPMYLDRRLYHSANAFWKSTPVLAVSLEFWSASAVRPDIQCPLLPQPAVSNKSELPMYYRSDILLLNALLLSSQSETWPGHDQPLYLADSPIA